MELIKQLPHIIEAMVKPMESIKDIKIISANGLFGGNNATQSNVDGVNDIFKSAFDYRMKVGAVDMLTKEVGIDLNAKNMSDIIPTIVLNNKEENKGA
jgi:uncharacterized membrane protein YqiK